MTETIPVSFDWGDHCRVPVDELIERDGKYSELSYDVVVSPYGSSGGWIVDVEDVNVLSVDDVAIPEWQREQVRAAFVQPAIELDADGLPLGLIGFEEYVETVIAVMGYGPESVEAARLRSPEFRPFAEESAISKTWNLWVGMWVAHGQIGPGVTNHVSTTQAEDGSTIELPYTIENMGRYPSGELWLRYLEVVGAETMGRVLGSRLGALHPDLDDETAASGMIRTTDLQFVTDPATLRPSSVSFDMTLATTETRQREVRHLTFDFDQAHGCG